MLIPQLGLGTWQSDKGEVGPAVKHAIKVGYRHIDCAYCYDNEKEVGEAIKQSIDEGLVMREDLFITSKLWATHHKGENVEKGVRESLQNLGLDYLNLYLIHFPVALKLSEEKELYPIDPNTGFTLDLDEETTLESTFLEMEKLVNLGLVKHIGLSNCTVGQIQRMMDCLKIKPANVQVEHHPYLPNVKVKEFCLENHISFTAYSPLGAANSTMRDRDQPVLTQDEVVLKIAQKYNTTPQHILLKWGLQHGAIVIPKSVTPAHIEANYEILELSDLKFEEMTELDNLHVLRGTFRTCFLIYFGLSKEFPHPDELTDEFRTMVAAIAMSN